MGKPTAVPRNPDDYDNGDQPSIQELMRHSAIIDANVDEEKNHQRKLEAMAEFGLGEDDAKKPSAAAVKKAETIAATQAKEIADLKAKLAALEAQAANAVPPPPPAPVATTTEVPPPPPADGDKPNPFA